MRESLLLRTIRGEEVERFPIWMMRQAGRYQASYQKLRQRYSFEDLIHQPELGAQVTMLPIEEFGFDAAILFSDILVVIEALGRQVSFVDGVGPVVDRQVSSDEDLSDLVCDNPDVAFSYVCDEIRMVQERLKPLGVPLIGFAGAPFTVASYLMGEKRGHDLLEMKQLLFHQPALVHNVLGRLADLTAIYVNQQLEAGVDMIQLFDSWTKVLSWSDFQTFSLPYVERLLAGIHNPRRVPIVLFGLGNSVFYPIMQDLAIDGLSFDSQVNIRQIRKDLRSDWVVQGNLDPYVLLAPRSVLKERVLEMLESMADQRRYIVNLGHGVMPNVPEDHVRFVVDLVQSFRCKS